MEEHAGVQLHDYEYLTGSARYDYLDPETNIADDQMGNLPPHVVWERQRDNFLNQIDLHLEKVKNVPDDISEARLVIDVTGMSAQALDDIAAKIASLGITDQALIILVSGP